MTKPEKLLSKIKAGRNNVRIGKLVVLMRNYGFTDRRNVHTYMFQHPLLRGQTVTVAIPHGGEKKVLKKYVDNCIDAIEQLMEVQDD